MATSLFDFLMETMPLAGVRRALEAQTNGQVPFAETPVAQLRSMLRYLPPDQDYRAPTPTLRVPAESFDQEQPAQGLWSWAHRASEPAKVTDLTCRVRDAQFAEYKVLESIEWGLEDPVGTFKNAVRVTNSAGVAIELPLTQRFVHWKWVAVAGYLPDDATPLWRLKALHDRSLVVAFVYDLDPSTSQPVPMREAAQSDPNRAAELEKLEKVARELTAEAAASAGPEDSSAPGTLAKVDDMTWVGRMQLDSFMEGHGAESAVGGEVGEQCTAKTGAPRILVVLSLTVCRERADFEPGGIVGMARLYPHVMVWANVPLSKIEGSVRFDRPARTTPMGPASEKGHECCKGHDSMSPDINAILVTDVNKDESKITMGGLLPPLPFWSNMFAYYRTEAPTYFKQQRLHMVRTDKPDLRDNDDGWIVRDIVGGGVSRTVGKAPRQGAFDNIHMAPKMKLVDVQKVAFKSPGDTEGIFPVERYTMGLDDITMAPFCAHDCFHLHWRWGTEASKKWSLGWDATGPYKTPGAPMVPVNQDVYFWFRSKSSFTYHVVVSPKPGTSYIMPGDCQTLMYHGAAYAVAVSGAFQTWMAKQGVSTFASPPWFIREYTDSLSQQNTEIIEANDSWSMFYWWLRFKGEFVGARDGAGPSYVIKERTTITDEGLEKAMNL
jgi:hypothetical protein